MRVHPRRLALWSAASSRRFGSRPRFEWRRCRLLLREAASLRSTSRDMSKRLRRLNSGESSPHLQRLARYPGVWHTSKPLDACSLQRAGVARHPRVISPPTVPPGLSGTCRGSRGACGCPGSWRSASRRWGRPMRCRCCPRRSQRRGALRLRRYPQL